MARAFFMGSLMLSLAIVAWSQAAAALVATALQRTPHLDVDAFSADGKWLAIGSAWIDSRGELKLLDVTTGKERLICNDHSDAINAIAFAPDGTMLASGDWRGMVKVWDTATGKQLATFQAHTLQVWRLSFSPNGKILACSSPTAITLWEVATGKKRTVIPTPGEERALLGPHAGYCVVFSPDGRTLAYGADDGAARLWDLATGKERALLKGHAKAVTDAAFTPDGGTLATASLDATVRLWDVATGQHIATLKGHKGPLASVVFSPDGRILASWCWWSKKLRDNNVQFRQEVKVWEVATGKERLTFEPAKANDDGGWPLVSPLQFTGNGNILLTVGAEHTVKQWDLTKLAAKTK
jgi:WD40 repeat protein